MIFPMHATRVAASVLLTASLLAAAAGAQTTTDNSQTDDRLMHVDEEIVVSAGLVDQPQSQVGSSVTVINRAEIERRNKTTVLELLRTVPGLEVAQTGGPGKTTSVFIRGGNSAHTLVTVDGVRVNSNTAGSFDIADLTSDNLERIEVLRGPQGVLYGSEAVTGVISIITRTGAGAPEFWARGEAGSDDFSRLAAGVSGGDEHLNYSVAASRLSTDAVSAASESAGNTENDPWTNLTLSGRLGAAFWGDGSVDLAVRYTEGDSDVDGFAFGIGPVDDLNAEQERESTTAVLTFKKPVTERWTQSLEIANSRDLLIGIDPDNFFSNFEIESITSVLRTQADIALSKQGNLSVGYQVEKREAENVGSFDESLYLRSFFAENLWTWGNKASLSLGVRNDDHSIFGDETTYRVATSISLGSVVRFHGSLGTGFKAPTFNDLYFPGFGNADLDPETSEGFDAGFEASFADSGWSFDVTYFDTDFEDLILFTFPAGFVNVAEAESSGIELTASWRSSDDFELRASHTYNETEDLSSGQQLARRPENRSTFDVFFEPIKGLRANASWIVVSDRIDSDGSQMDDYERLDLSVDYQLSQQLKPFLRIENLLDEDYSEIPGYTAPGATFAIGLRFSR